MYCLKCGNVLKDNAKFCGKCGTKTNGATMQAGTVFEQGRDSVNTAKKTNIPGNDFRIETSGEKKKKPVILWICIAAIIVACAVVGVVFLLFKGKDSGTEYGNKIAEASDYLKEENYDSAIKTYKEAIKLDPQNTEAYIELAKTYEKQGRFEEAVSMLEDAEDGMKNSDDKKTLEKRKEKLEKKLAEEKEASLNSPTQDPESVERVTVTPSPTEEPADTPTPAPTEDITPEPTEVVTPELTEEPATPEPTSAGTVLVEVPPVVGLTVDDAQKVLVAVSPDFVIYWTEEEYSDEIEKGKVCAQYPSDGAVTVANATIKLTVSAGSEMKPLGNVSGYDMGPAIELLYAWGYDPVWYEVYSDTVESGKVVSTDPEEGTFLPKGSEVKVFVSVGKEPSAKMSDEDRKKYEAIDVFKGYLMPMSCERYLDERVLWGKSEEECRFILNEIYARYGHIFTTKSGKDLKDYFESQYWYEGLYVHEEKYKNQDNYRDVAIDFNEYAKKNSDMMIAYRDSGYKHKNDKGLPETQRTVFFITTGSDTLYSVYLEYTDSNCGFMTVVKSQYNEKNYTFIDKSNKTYWFVEDDEMNGYVYEYDYEKMAPKSKTDISYRIYSDHSTEGGRWLFYMDMSLSGNEIHMINPSVDK